MSKTQLEYNDDPNELVTRLNLLMSQNAGNTSVNNVIISILEELRERGILLFENMLNNNTQYFINVIYYTE